MDLCEPRYREVYATARDLAIDESVACLSESLCLPKPTRLGIKQFSLCESKPGYALKLLTYLGKGTVEQVPGYSQTPHIHRKGNCRTSTRLFYY